MAKKVTTKKVVKAVSTSIRKAPTRRGRGVATTKGIGTGSKS